MYYNNQNRPKTSVYGCSSTPLLFGLLLLILVFSGGLFFIFRYFALFFVLGLVVWFFRKFIIKSDDTPRSSGGTKTTNWSRDFESNEDTAYDNIEREFEEIDDDE